MTRMIAVGVCTALLLAACDDEATRRADPAPSAEPTAVAVEPPAADAVGPTDTVDGADAAASVLSDYFSLVVAGRKAGARALWAPGTDGETIAQLGEGDADAGSISATLGTPGRIEGAAGSRYVSIPVSVEVVQRDGGVHRYEGSYALRRSVVDGATPEQRQWRIHSEDMREVAPAP